MTSRLSNSLARIEWRRQENEESLQIWKDLGNKYLAPDGTPISRAAFRKATQGARKFTIELSSSAPLLSSWFNGCSLSCNLGREPSTASGVYIRAQSDGSIERRAPIHLDERP